MSQVVGLITRKDGSLKSNVMKGFIFKGKSSKEYNLTSQKLYGNILHLMPKPLMPFLLYKIMTLFHKII